MVTVERYFQHHIRTWIQELDDNITILDIGCGTGHIGLWIASEYPIITANCQDKDYDERHKLKNIEIIGLDSYEPALRYLSRLQVYDTLKNIDIIHGLNYDFPPIDIAIAYGVMNHLEKLEALQLISEMKKIANHIIVTASTQMYQHEGIQNSSSVEALRHKSSYSCRDFETLGLQTRMLSYKGNLDKTTTLETFLTPYTFGLSALHHKLKQRLRIPLTLTHWLNYFGDGIIAWRAKD